MAGGRAVMLPSFIASAPDAPAAFGIGNRARSGVSLGPGEDFMKKSGTYVLVGNRTAIPRFRRPLPSICTNCAVSGPYTKCTRLDTRQTERTKTDKSDYHSNYVPTGNSKEDRIFFQSRVANSISEGTGQCVYIALKYRTPLCEVGCRIQNRQRDVSRRQSQIDIIQ